MLSAGLEVHEAGAVREGPRRGQQHYQREIDHSGGTGGTALAVVTFGISTKWTNTIEPALKKYDAFPGTKIKSYFHGSQYGLKHFILEKAQMTVILRLRV
jgi:hypothetical protein